MHRKFFGSKIGSRDRGGVVRDRNLPLEVEFEFTHDLKAMMIKIMKRNSFPGCHSGIFFLKSHWNFDKYKRNGFLLQVNLCQKLFFLHNMGRTCCVQKLFWMSETISVHNMFSAGLCLEFFMYWTCNAMNNLSSYCGLVDAKIRASDKDLPIHISFFNTFLYIFSLLLVQKRAGWLLWCWIVSVKIQESTSYLVQH